MCALEGEESREGFGHLAGVACLDRPADEEISVKRGATTGRRRQIRL
jgi:hypothetical protein